MIGIERIIACWGVVGCINIKVLRCTYDGVCVRTGAVCRAFALEGRGIWHALSVSAAQQVYGPVRARADFRFALESPPAAPSEDPGRATLEGAWKARFLAGKPLQ